MAQEKTVRPVHHDLPRPKGMAASENVGVIIDDADPIGRDLRMLLEPIDNSLPFARPGTEDDARVIVEVPAFKSAREEQVARVVPANGIKPGRGNDNLRAGDFACAIE